MLHFSLFLFLLIFENKVFVLLFPYESFPSYRFVFFCARSWMWNRRSSFQLHLRIRHTGSNPSNLISFSVQAYWHIILHQLVLELQTLSILAFKQIGTTNSCQLPVAWSCYRLKLNEMYI